VPPDFKAKMHQILSLSAGASAHTRLWSLQRSLRGLLLRGGMSSGGRASGRGRKGKGGSGEQRRRREGFDLPSAIG